VSQAGSGVRESDEKKAAQVLGAQTLSLQRGAKQAFKVV
jgi:hypothetical protein